jgi:phosphonoacetaldehyde hydrolase
MSARPTDRIRLVVLDWAGTTIDFGSLAPVAAFTRVFAAHGVPVTAVAARGPMGAHKKDHLRAMLADPEVQSRYRAAHGREPTQDDLEAMYRDLGPAQLEAVEEHSRLTPGVVECAAALGSRGVLLGGTTGYFRAAAERCASAAARQGYAPDANVSADDVPAGRPAPWMLFRVMERLDVYPPAAVLKVGDTLLDVQEGRNAGAWSIAVLAGSSELGLSEAEYRALAQAERQRRLRAAAERFLAAGAHGVIESLHELPAFVSDLEGRMCSGLTPAGPAPCVSRG